jgi:purine/pyrimidine-nucleoside phosphorylase
MSQFENVTIIKEVNAYFDGKVTSRIVQFPDGTHKTLGVMLPGEYDFGTDDKEIMEIMSGDLEIMLPGSSEWQVIKGGETFEVPASSRFQLKVHGITDYCCSYIKE